MANTMRTRCSDVASSGSPLINPETMPAGRRIDYLCAQCVGWRRVHLIDTNYLVRPGFDLGLPRGWLDGAEVDWEAASMPSQARALVPPFYSEHLVQAWGLVKWMGNTHGYWCQARTPSTPEGSYWCGFSPCGLEDMVYVRPCHWHSADSLPLAICRSFLSFHAEQGSLPSGTLIETDDIVGRWHHEGSKA